MFALIRLAVMFVVVSVIALMLGCYALIMAVAPPLTGRGPHGPTTWKAGLVLRPAGDTLELHAAPGKDHPLVAAVPSDGVRVATLGEAYRTEGRAWVYIRVINSTHKGWVPYSAIVPLNP